MIYHKLFDSISITGMWLVYYTTTALVMDREPEIGFLSIRILKSAKKMSLR